MLQDIKGMISGEDDDNIESEKVQTDELADYHEKSRIVERMRAVYTSITMTRLVLFQCIRFQFVGVVAEVIRTFAEYQILGSVISRQNGVISDVGPFFLIGQDNSIIAYSRVARGCQRIFPADQDNAKERVKRADLIWLVRLYKWQIFLCESRFIQFVVTAMKLVAALGLVFTPTADWIPNMFGAIVVFQSPQLLAVPAFVGLLLRIKSKDFSDFWSRGNGGASSTLSSSSTHASRSNDVDAFNTVNPMMSRSA